MEPAIEIKMLKGKIQIHLRFIQDAVDDDFGVNLFYAGAQSVARVSSYLSALRCITDAIRKHDMSRTTFDIGGGKTSFRGVISSNGL